MKNREECRAQNQSNSIALSQATLLSLPLFGTVQSINQTDQLKPLWAEVDPGFLCTIISQEFLAAHLANRPVDALKKLPSACNRKPISAIQGTVDVRACFAAHAMDATVYVGCNLIDGLGLIMHGGSSQAGPV